MNCICGKELSGKQRFCSDKCRMMFNRTTRTGKTEQPEQNTQPEQVEQTKPNISNKPCNYGLTDCTCMHCQTARVNKSNARLNHGEPMSAADLVLNGYTHNRVTLPGDADYVGVCSEAVLCNP